MIRVSAPGKIMLMGEHAVVYGAPSIVSAVDTRLTVAIEEISGSDIQIDAPQVSNTAFISRAIESVRSSWADLPGMKIVTQSDFSPLYGLGSSSAVTVATIFALHHFLKRKESLEEVFLLARKVITDVQGNGSGFDVASALFGGTILYEKTVPTIESLSVQTLPLVVGYTGQKADTVKLIEEVAQKRDQQKEKVDRIFEAISALVLDAKVKMVEGDWQRVGKLFDFNQEYLRDLGVSSEKLESLISAAKNAGAWGAKLSGAGGGDCMIAVVEDAKKDAVIQAIQKAGGEIVQATLGAEGVRVES
jgi:mevalonate kinase